MKFKLRTLSIGIASVLAASCASQPQDIDRMRSLVNQAASGSDGACVVALHEAAISLEEAQVILAQADAEGVDDFEYRRGIAAAENAINARKTIATQCTTRVSALALQSEEMQADIIETQIGVLQTQAILAKLYARTERLPGVTFERDSSKLKEEALPILDAIADRLVKENKKVEIAGHTSSTGSAVPVGCVAVEDGSFSSSPPQPTIIGSVNNKSARITNANQDNFPIPFPPCIVSCTIY